jgi:ABC-type methionine transport system permease subunit
MGIVRIPHAVITENSVRMSTSIPYATLIADLVDQTGFVVGKHIGV